MTEKLRAERAWCVAGKAINALKTMSAEEITQLSTLVDEQGKPVEGFREKLADFMTDYLAERKATDDEEHLGGFGRVKQSPPTEELATTEE